MSDNRRSELTRHETSCLTVLGADGRREEHRRLRCTLMGASVSPEACLRCGRVVELRLTDTGAIARVHCRSDTAVRQGPPLLLPHVTVADLMQLSPVCVRPELTLDAALPLFIEGGAAAIAVLGPDDSLLGFVHESDLSLEVQARRSSKPGGATVGDVMGPCALAVPEETPVARAAALMADERQTEVGVVDSGGSIVGVLAAADILSWLGAADDPARPTPTSCRSKP